jgi:DNA-binding transcriptional LysR family regulator
VRHLAPALIAFHERYPDVRVNMSLTDRPVDLHAEQIDVAFRVGPLGDSNLMSRKIAEVERVICASPHYVERFGAPKTPADLAQHRCIAFTVPGRTRWPFKTAEGGPKHMDVVATFASDSLECILQLALQGAGIARLGDYMAAGPIRARKLVPLLVDQHHPERSPALPYSHRARRRSRKYVRFSIFWSSASDASPGGSAGLRGAAVAAHGQSSPAVALDADIGGGDAKNDPMRLASTHQLFSTASIH